MVAERKYSELATTVRAALATTESTPGVSKPDPILVADGVRRHFGGVVA
ncbi:MAG: ABC transporter ATP-binding protein, partial [Actinobacteria bacterium]|nr:ABC transporter ATP-binding protein [Actinomycetota bacterium]